MKKDKAVSTPERKIPALDVCAERIAETVGAFVGHGPCKMPVEGLAELMGCSAQAIYAYKSGENTPRGSQLLQMAAIFGPDFVNRLISPFGMAGAYDVNGKGLPILDISAGLSDSAGRSIRAGADGKIDHIEAAELATDYRGQAAVLNNAAAKLEDIARRGGSVPTIQPKSTH